MKAPLLRANWLRTLLIALLVLAAALGIILTLPESLSSRVTRCEELEDQKQQCFEELILEEARTRGIDAAFDALAFLYARDREFAEYCHGNTHELGGIAYESFKRKEDITLSAKTSYCGFGFYHGFMEALLFDSGDLTEARRFCEYADEKLRSSTGGVSFACYHGIGHGVIDGSDPSTWGSAPRYIEKGLALCDTLGEVEEHKERCASGVFNALAIAYREPKYRLAADPDDPFGICRIQEKRYAREACYDQMNTYIVETAPSFRAALALAQKAESAYVETAVTSVAGYQAQGALAKGADFGEYLSACSELPGSLPDVCASGFAVGLIEFGEPGKEYVVAIQACATHPERAQACFLGVSRAVRDRLKPEMWNEVCSGIESAGGAETADACRELMRI